MAERRRSEPLLDEAIDRAVRAMMDVDTRPDFERRVMRRLTGEGTRVSAWPRLAATAAVLAAVVLAVLLRDQSSAPLTPVPEVVVGQKAPEPPQGVGDLPAVTAEPPTMGHPADARRTSKRKYRHAVTPASIEEAQASTAVPMIPTLPALAPPSALVVAEIEPGAMSIAEIALAPIQVSELNVPVLRHQENGREE